MTSGYYLKTSKGFGITILVKTVKIVADNQNAQKLSCYTRTHKFLGKEKLDQRSFDLNKITWEDL